MPQAIAVIPTDLQRSRLGLPSRVRQVLGGRTVLEHVLRRVAQVKAVEAIVLVHPADQDVFTLVGEYKLTKPVHTLANAKDFLDVYEALRMSARKWAMTSWRGGLGGATCYDELLPAKPILIAMDEHKVGSALLVGADWPLVDPDYCQQVLELNMAHPQAMKMTFTQAPPGLAGVAVDRQLIEQMVDSHAMFGHLLSYDPRRPQADPIGREVCVQIPASVRSCSRRFIYDTPRSASMIDAVCALLGDQFSFAGGEQIATAVTTLQNDADWGVIPQQVTLEVTPKRVVTGPIVPQHYVDIDREPMPLDTANRIFKQLGQIQDVVLTLGGLGDALLHDDWESIVLSARESGVLGIAIETDLLVDRDVVARLLQLPIDVVTVRLNADCDETYRQVMDHDGFKQVTDHMQWFLATRNQRINNPQHDANLQQGVPWLVPRFVKADQTLADMESYFDRWVYFAGHAVIESAAAGCGLMPPLSPIRMAPPQRCSCRQLLGRMTILSDATLAQCDQDWLGRATAGDVCVTPIAEIWESMQSLRDAQQDGRWNENRLCATCHEWHRP